MRPLSALFTGFIALFFRLFLRNFTNFGRLYFAELFLPNFFLPNILIANENSNYDNPWEALQYFAYIPGAIEQYDTTLNSSYLGI